MLESVQAFALGESHLSSYAGCYDLVPTATKSLRHYLMSTTVL
jgi:hypothetical protein